MAPIRLITRKRVKAKPQDIDASSGHSHRLWPVRRHSNVGDICFGGAASEIYSGIRRIVRLGVDIWVPARRLAIWSRRSDLGVGCRPPLVEKGVESVSISGQRAFRRRRSAAQHPIAHVPLRGDRQSLPECPPGDALQPGAPRRRCCCHPQQKWPEGREFRRA